MSVYRWSASSGIFFGSISTALLVEEALRFHLVAHRHAFVVFLGASFVGIATSLVALFLHQDEDELSTLLGHRAVAFIGIGLSSWPWVLMVWLLWFLDIGPP
jgi:hypothetical protein